MIGLMGKPFRPYASFNGTDSYVDLSAHIVGLRTAATNTASFTGWIRPNFSHAAAGGTIFAIQQNKTLGTGVDFFNIYYGANTGAATNELITIVKSRGAGGSANPGIAWHTEADAARYTGNWLHVAVILNPLDWTIYINGVIVSIVVASGSAIGGFLDGLNTMGNAFIGGRFVSNVLSSRFNGDISRFRYWNKALSATEVAQDMASMPGAATNLVAAYPFDMNSNDISGNNYHGTAYNLNYV